MSTPELNEKGEEGPPDEGCLEKDNRDVEENETQRMRDNERDQETGIMRGKNGIQEASKDISQEMEYKCKLPAFSLLRQKGVEYRRRGSLCSDGQDCLYAELLDLEERKVVELEEKAEELKKKVEKSLEELTAVKQAHLKFVSEVRTIAEAKRNCKSALQELLRKENCLEDVACVEDDSYTTVNFSEDQDFHSLMNDLDQECLSPAHTESTEERDIGESSEVEEMQTFYAEERDIDGDQQTGKVAVVDEEDVPGDVHEEDDDRAQKERLELDSIEKQLELLGEGSPSSLTLNKELEAMGERSPVASTLDVNSNHGNKGIMVCQLCGIETVKDLQVMSEHLTKQHQIEVEHGEGEEEEEMRSTNHLPRKSGRPRGPGRKGKKLMKENSQGQEMQIENTKQLYSAENSQGQDLQREGTKQQDSLKGNGSNQSEGTSSLEQLSKRKRSIGARRSIGAGGEDLDTVTLEQLLRNLQRHEDSWPFIRPVNPVSAPDYHLIVKNPTNLEKIRRQLDGMKTYTDNRQVLDDIQLVFDNCRLYNQPDAEEYECAERLERYCDEMKEELGLSNYLLDGAE